MRYRCRPVCQPPHGSVQGERFRKAQDDEIPIEQALKQLDQDRKLLIQASQMQCLPNKEKQMLQDEIKKTCQAMDEALDESARQDPKHRHTHPHL